MTAAEQTKVVVRGLPPSLTEANFKAEMDKEGFADRCNWFSFSHGKHSLRTTRNSTAYINFNSAADLLAFSACFDGRKFAGDGGGGQTTCSVEYAPFRKIFRGRVKRDPREGTIEQDAAYQAFLQELEQKPEMLPSAEQQLEELEADGDKAPIITPLMQFMHEKLAPKQRKAVAAPKGRIVSGSSGLRSDAEAAPRSSKDKESAKRSSTSAAAAGRRSDVPDTGQAARDAARRAMGLPPSTSDGSRQPEASEPVQAKARERPAKEPKVRPGFGAWQPRRSGTDAAEPGSDSAAAAASAVTSAGRGNNGKSGAAAPAASQPGKAAVDWGATAEASVAAAAKAATAALRGRATELVSASRDGQSSKGRKSHRESGREAGAAEQPAGQKGSSKASKPVAGPSSQEAGSSAPGRDETDAAPAQSKGRRKNKGRGGSSGGDASTSQAAAAEAPAAQPQTQRSASGDGSQKAEGSAQPAAARKSRQRNRQKKPAQES